MNRNVILLEETVGDIEAGREFYDVQDEGVGDYFVSSLVSDIRRLELAAGIHSRHLGVHRMLAQRFPFGIYYRIVGPTVEVIGILDLRRSADWIRKQLRHRLT